MRVFEYTWTDYVPTPCEVKAETVSANSVQVTESGVLMFLDNNDELIVGVNAREWETVRAKQAE